MTEANARLMLIASVITGTIAAIVAIALGLRGEQTMALFFLVIAVLDIGVALFFMRRYGNMRKTRWQDELSDSEQELNRLMADEAKPETPRTTEENVKSET
jgi:cell division protein FtsW (lipid II flippase)